MKSRTLLVSLLALPACGSAVEEDRDPQVPDGGDPAKFDERCRSHLRSLYACYTEAYGSVDESGVPDLEEYVEAYCGEQRAQIEAYGDACLGAYEEIFACVSSLDCSILVGEESEEASDSFGFVPEPCRDVYLDAAERCPEAVPACLGASIGLGGDEGSCSVGGQNCLDGHEYAVECAGDGTCTCAVDEEVVRTVTVSTDLECVSQEWLDELRARCQFPVRAF